MTIKDPPALDGIKILDLSRHLPGPLATMFLADMGAEVIKLEDTVTGDPLRSIPPLIDGVSAMFLAINRSKRSVSMDLKKPKGRELALELMATCDVVVEGFRPGVMKNLGLAYEDLKAVKKDIILCSITGYGQSGPDSQMPGHDINYCARTGILARSGAAGLPPQICGAQVADVAGGTWPAVSAIIAALFQKLRTGSGQWIDIALADAACSTMALNLGPVLAGKQLPPKGQGPLDGGLPSYGIYATKDGKYLAVGALEGKFFRALCKALDLEDLQDQGMSTGQQGQKVRRALEEKFLSMSREQCMARLEGVDCCVEPVLDLDQVPSHPQFLARGMFIPSDGALAYQMASPIKMAGRISTATRAPNLGEHTLEILHDMGMAHDDIHAMASEGIVMLGKKKP